MYTHKQPKPESTLDLTAASFLEARAELRSLSIPGTYQEKITHLGNSLMNLTGLKSLDLSRNSLVSLEGIQYLLALQSLNLYYNCVSSLAEVLRLHPLTELVDVDLRLNPVVRSESDYRLFVVHMLPRLRQLDDRPVRESERKASQLHFASEDSLDTKESCLAAVGVGRPGHLRGRCAHTPASACLAMDADDEAVLNLIAECEWDLSNPPGSASSTQECEADCYSPKVAFSKPEPRYPLSPQSMQHQRGDSTQGHRRRKSHPRGRCPEKTLQNPCSGEPEASCLFKPRAHFTPYPDSVMEDVASSSQKSSLSTWQVSEPLPTPETCRKTRGPGGRAQECPSHLGRTSGPPSPEGSLSTPRRSESRSEGASSRPEASETDMQSQSCGVSASDCGEPPPACSPARPRRKATPEAALLQALLNLVDGYWGSHRPLQSHATFLGELAAARDTATAVSEELCQSLENGTLPGHPAELQQHSRQTADMLAALSSTRGEMDDLRQHLDRSSEESSSLRSLLSSMKAEVQTTGTTTALRAEITGLETSVKQLSSEIAELRQHLQHYDQIQELTRMLQESHSSLVSTNEHLLRELGQARAQHRAEVEQLHWSYQELKKTMALTLHGSAGPGGRPAC
ncbi:centrosomal protein of 72 kDa isoform X2 [Tupaia chinensis]|uniref:centrosomal protein of 72 kDa isoform X2 n=1 Tax=Tupaia chinensis TaxID=246437 RepID=UPI000FFC4967|nr:centrosomal protein of 72 kDa isoform X2 [Tupaia chinensis]